MVPQCLISVGSRIAKSSQFLPVDEFFSLSLLIILGLRSGFPIEINTKGCCIFYWCRFRYADTIRQHARVYVLCFW
ncbi:hypothetical protein RDI58_013496 [Solanum bulbocastanum]|uniref:Uncharacterized protein n=1 Tax=Solanum bulbocastanum TaxID=147425 RepID=A0AAN8TTR2_SOLBU